MLAAPLTPQTRETTLTRAVAALTTASRKLAAVAAEQASREAAIQELCNAVWAVEQKQYSVSGKCGEAQQYTVTHQYTQNLAAISAAKFGALRQHMRQHLQFAASELASSLFEHARCEEQLSSFADKHVLQTHLPPAELQRLLSAVCAPLLATGTQLDSSGSLGGALDARSLPCLRRIALVLGSQLIHSAPADQPPHLLGGPSSASSPSSCGGQGSTSSSSSSSSSCGASVSYDHTLTAAAILQLVWHGKGCGWAAPLLQPTIADLVGCRWLWYVLPAQAAMLQTDIPALRCYLVITPPQVRPGQPAGGEGRTSPRRGDCRRARPGWSQLDLMLPSYHPQPTPHQVEWSQRELMLPSYHPQPTPNQVEWSQLASLSAADADAYVVQPIQRVLRRTCEMGQPNTLLLLAQVHAP